MKKLFLAALGGLTLLSSAQATKYPLTVTDDLGRRVTLKAEPKRIVTLLPSHTETLFAIGAGGKLVGIDEYSNYPRETAGITKVGSGFQPDIEKIVALKPDLVLVDESSSARLAEKLSAVGLTVYGGTPQTYNEVFEKIVVLGKMTNRETGATNLVVKMRRELSALERSVVNRPKVSTYFEVDPTPYSVGPNSYIGTLITRGGGRNIVPASLGDFPKVDPELVVRANPQVMIGLTVNEARRRPGWSNLQAVRSGRVYQPTNAERDAIARPGPRLPEAMRALIKVMHPGAVK
ncbi:ABC transporter substrate-binding protein [Deinococcus radiophilus]|uniref:ABC transporter substrate-binding protein n=2 Tax=Deinococcus radiophilus TaxID=32062 RepID=A0A3S0I1H2_9DEIO|nr:ABC transporter substrate-binding protein [Deinococcus radiophilus]RTR25271.1 ABC transporter substrate-binding protein [Deinococcus radiophilus]UFA51469.1 ABC transporter substrate-binding protein [Deinococcus radiophilus]